jgi:hypothetical protein
MNALTLVQTSPASNPDKNIVKCVITGAYVNGTADTLPLSAIADSQVLVQVPFNQQNLTVTPSILNEYVPGYYAQVQRVTTAGVVTFGLRWFQLSTGAELVTEAYPAAILAAELFLEILCPTT